MSVFALHRFLNNGGSCLDSGRWPGRAKSAYVFLNIVVLFRRAIEWRYPQLDNHRLRNR